MGHQQNSRMEHHATIKSVTVLGGQPVDTDDRSAHLEAVQDHGSTHENNDAMLRSAPVKHPAYTRIGFMEGGVAFDGVAQ